MLQHRKSCSALARAAEKGIAVMDGGESPRIAWRWLQEGVAGTIGKRPYGNAVKPTKRQRDVAEGAWDKRNPLGSIAKLVKDTCRMRDVIPEAELQEYDVRHLYTEIGGSVLQLIQSEIDASNTRRAQRNNDGAA